METPLPPEVSTDAVSTPMVTLTVSPILPAFAPVPNTTPKWLKLTDGLVSVMGPRVMVVGFCALAAVAPRPLPPEGALLLEEDDEDDDEEDDEDEELDPEI